ncbi:hypothetical protein ACTFIZ_000918 [Dictyostelium cf. discoideum]
MPLLSEINDDDHFEETFPSKKIKRNNKSKSSQSDVMASSTPTKNSMSSENDVTPLSTPIAQSPNSQMEKKRKGDKDSDLDSDLSQNHLSTPSLPQLSQSEPLLKKQKVESTFNENSTDFDFGMYRMGKNILSIDQKLRLMKLAQKTPRGPSFFEEITREFNKIQKTHFKTKSIQDIIRTMVHRESKYQFSFKNEIYDSKKQNHKLFQDKLTFEKFQSYSQNVFEEIKKLVIEYNKKEAQHILLSSENRLCAKELKKKLDDGTGERKKAKNDRYKNLMLHYAQDYSFKQHISLLLNASMQCESVNSAIELTNASNSLISNKIQLLKLLIQIDPSNSDLISKINSIQEEINEIYCNILDTKTQQKKATEFVKEVERVIEDANVDQTETIVKKDVNEDLEETDGYFGLNDREDDYEAYEEQ